MLQNSLYVTILSLLIYIIFT